MKKTVFYILSLLWTGTIFLYGCEQEIELNLGNPKPIPVINCILRAGDDSVRIRVMWTKRVYDQEAPVEPHASVKLYKEGNLVGKASYCDNGWYVLAHKIESSVTYRVEAEIKEKKIVWGETRIPAPILNAKIEYDTLQEKVINHWEDRIEEKNYYWLSHAYSRGQEVMDTVQMELSSFIKTNSTLPDPFNRNFDFDEEIPTGYDYYLRIEDSGLTGKKIELRYQGKRLNYRGGRDSGYYKETHFILSIDRHYDRYLKSSILNNNNLSETDSEPLFYAPLWSYSNVHEGTGLVASYSKFEDKVILKLKKRKNNIDFSHKP